MTTPISAHTPRIQVNGTDLAQRWLDRVVGLRVGLAFMLPGRATVRFVDDGFALASTNVFSLGAEVRLSVVDGVELLLGQVTGVTLEQTQMEQPELVVVIDDFAHKLGRGNQVRTFTQVSHRDVITRMAQDLGLRSKVALGAAGSTPNPYLLQSGSDLAYLSRIAERAGCVWWVAGRILNVADPARTSRTVDLTLGDELLELSVRASGLRPDEVKVSGWDVNQKVGVIATSSRTVPAPSEFVSAYTSPKKGLGSKAVLAAADQNVITSQEAQAMADSLSGGWSASSVVAEGTTLLNGAIALGVAVRVKNSGPVSGTYVVSEVEHVYSPSGSYTRFTTGTNRPAGLVDTLGTESPSPGYSMDGMIVGVVTNIRDPESVGRLKVKYVGLSGEIESNWARVLTIGAGPKRGVVFLPEVNDEVLVGFERGDTRRPVVLGGLFSKKAAPPWKPAEGENAVSARHITSRLGHSIEMGDGTSPDKQHLLLLLNGGHKLRLGEDRFDIEVSQGKPVLIKAGNAKFEIDASGNVNIEGMTITLKGTQAVKIEAPQIQVKAQAQASLEAATVAVKGQASASVEAGGSLSLKGAVVAIN